MKKLILSIACYLIWFSLQAQVPQAFSFQGVAFDANGKPVADKDISIKAEILNGSPTGNVDFSETHSTTTNANGLYSLSIGLGAVSSGTFDNIDWSTSQKYLSISIDPNGGNNFLAVGLSQLLSVPYALVSGSSLDTKPKIYVKSAPFGGTAIVKNKQDFSGLGSIKYVYEWIQGTPEDIYVVYDGLPDNINIFTNAVGGFGLDTPEESTTKFEIISDGILKRQSFLGVADKNINVPIGTYQLTLVFETKDGEVLATLPYKLIVE
ncbi:MAG: hypothetical protein IPN79_17050 [Saprospiraceae bacterium]|nr:hypothetical protein [Saprospiraceae bacterium]